MSWPVKWEQVLPGFQDVGCVKLNANKRFKFTPDEMGLDTSLIS